MQTKDEKSSTIQACFWMRTNRGPCRILHDASAVHTAHHTVQQEAAQPQHTAHSHSTRTHNKVLARMWSAAAWAVHVQVSSHSVALGTEGPLACLNCWAT
jgi:hypothetical protein